MWKFYDRIDGFYFWNKPNSCQYAVTTSAEVPDQWVRDVYYSFEAAKIAKGVM